MRYWELFWTAFLIVSGVSFAFITAVVTFKGFGDLRRMFSGLNQQRKETPRD